MTKTTRRAAAALFAGAVLAGFGCTDDDQADPFFELDGDTYSENFWCNKTFTGQPTTCPDPNRTDQVLFERTAPNTFEVRDVPDTGFLMVGSFSGFDFHWTATRPTGATKSGTWTFSSDGNSFAGPSHYVADDGSYSGDCNTNGDFLGPAPDPPAPAGCP